MILLINNFIFDIENFILIEKPIITSLAEFLVYKRFFFQIYVINHFIEIGLFI